MTQTEFYMTSKMCLKGIAVQQADEGESVAYLYADVYLKYEKHPKCPEMAVILHLKDQQFLVDKTSELRQIAMIYQECKERKTDLALQLISYTKNHLKQL